MARTLTTEERARALKNSPLSIIGVRATAYDKAGRVLTETDANGHSTKYQYTKNDLVSQVTDPLGNTTQFSYTTESPLEKVTYANGANQRLAYDLTGNVIDLPPDPCTSFRAS